MPFAAVETTIREMTLRHSYAVSWQEDDRPTVVGRLDLGPRRVRMEGRSGSGESRRVLRYGDIADVHTRRSNGHRVLELRLAEGATVVVASLDRPGSLNELAEELRARTAKPQPGSGGAPMPAGV
jgi:hypothetical protein